eukprot:Rhum_TRINITY_DN12320_c0_g1::Rhum_TRINITY_DN12320_c0_g1_i1::g.51042::m.51042/K15258/PARP6_8; poly [ADP-ribose] polymerase 6/8
MPSLAEAIDDVNENPPDYLYMVELQDEGILVTMANCDEYSLMVPEHYSATYPEGEVSAVLGCNFEVLGEGDLRTVLDRLNAKASSVLPRTETSYSGCDDSDGLARQDTSYGAEAELEAHPQLLKDLQRVRDRYGPDMVEVEHLKLLDQVVVTLLLHVDYLDSTVYAAWGLAPKSEKKPVKVKVTFSRSGYTDAQKYLVSCSQDGREWCGLAGQLARILKYFLDDQWKLRKQPSKEVAEMVGRGFGFEESTSALAANGGRVERAVSAIVNSGKKGATVGGDGKWAKKKLPPPTYGLLVQLMDYAHSRVKSCPDFCVICDQPHVFGTNMLKASVCYREVCAFAFQQLGVGSDSAKELATDSGVVDLLVLMARAAAESGRWELIFNPYPTLFDPKDPSKKILHPSSKNIEAARKIFKGIPSVKDFVTGNAVDARQHQHARPLVQWIVTSNTSHLVKLRNEQRIACIGTPHQFLLVSAPPEKQEAFQRQKKKYGTIWAFHGSATENWHSIMRNGLVNASGGKLMVNGAAYGSGIYLSPSAAVSLGYSRIGSTVESESRVPTKGKGGDEFIGENIGCMAICEVVNHDIKKSGEIWVMPHEEYVITRFFVVFDDKHQACSSHHCENKEFSDHLRRAADNFN